MAVHGGEGQGTEIALFGSEPGTGYGGDEIKGGAGGKAKHQPYQKQAKEQPLPVAGGHSEKMAEGKSVGYKSGQPNST